MESLFKIPFIPENGSNKIVCKEKKRDREQAHPTTPTFLHLPLHLNQQQRQQWENALGRKADQEDENMPLQAQHLSFKRDL